MSKMDSIIKRRSLAKSILSSNSVSAIPKFEMKKFLPQFESKRLKIEGGKAILVGKTQGRKFLSDTEKQISPTKKHMVLACSLSIMGMDEVYNGTPLGKDLMKTLEDMHEKQYSWIKEREIKRVPEDTGTLRRSLLRSLTVNRAKIKGSGLLIMEYGSRIPYLIYVNEMETYPMSGVEGILTGKHGSGTGPHLRHPPYVGNYKVGRGGTTLNDPWALKHFFGWNVLQARKNAIKVIRTAIEDLYIRKGQDHNWSTKSDAYPYFFWKNRPPRAGWSFF